MTATADSDTLQFVSFFVEERAYGLDIRLVKEINPNVGIARVPHAPPQIRGVVNIRGQVVLVIDVAASLGRAPRPITSDSHIVILKTAPELSRIDGLAPDTAIERFGDKPTSFLVDRIGDVVSVAASKVEPTPSNLSNEQARYLAGVIRIDGDLLAVLRAEELL
jgi:purine-binding chemotaxis protein CheW